MVKRGSESKVSEWKTVVTVLALVLVYPVGLVLMFVWMKWPMWVKVLVLLVGLVLFVVGILVLVAAVALVAIDPAGQIRKANDVKRKYDLKAINNCLTQYYVDNRRYPVTFDSLVPGCLVEFPLDPKTREPYEYRLAPDGQDYRVCAILENPEESGQFCVDKVGL